MGSNITDIMSLGEVLIDLTQIDTDENGIDRFAAFPGGAPANVAVAASKLGAHTAFAGKVGKDSFGRGLRQTLQSKGVSTDNLLETDLSPTTLAIVHVDDTGERSFAFYRQPGADTCLTSDEAIKALDNTKPAILHIGSLSLTTEPSRTAALRAVAHARAGGVQISYDPNYRPALWSDREEAVKWMKEPLGCVDILKVSDEELAMLTETEDLDEGSRILADYGIKLVLVTLGEKGVFYKYGNHTGKVAGVHVKVSDTNGAGDTFLGAVLAKISKLLNSNEKLTEAGLKDYLDFANRAAALTCSRPGAIPAMPSIDELMNED